MIVDEIRLAARALRRAPLFAAVSTASLAVGIGANVAVFSVANTLLLRPLPVAAAERLTRVGRTTREAGFGSVSFLEYRDIAATVAPIADLVGHYPSSAILTASDGPKAAWLELVSANYFSALGVRPAVGRAFAPGDDATPGASPTIVISHCLWRDRFAGDTTVVGRSVRLNGKPFTIVGVAPDTFRGTFTGFAIDGWVPVSMQAMVTPSAGSLDRRADRFLMLIAARHTGVDETTLGASLAVAAQRLQQVQADPNIPVRLRMASAGGVHPFVSSLVRAFVALLQGVVLLVLLIACVNLANVLLVRASARQRELAIRAALGATRWGLARIALAEALLIAICGGLIGTGLAAVVARYLERLDLPVGLPLGLTISLNGTVVLVALVTTGLTTIVFGAGPALAASRASALASLRVGGATTDRRRSRVRSALVGVQVAVATLLLVGSGLAIRSLRESALLDPGFSADRVQVISAAPDLLGYDETRGRALWNEIVDRTSRVTGVQSASLALFVPLGSRGDLLSMAPAEKRSEERGYPYNIVRPGYFDMLGVRLVAGRDLSPNDAAGSPDVAVVSEAMARRLFGSPNAVGRSLFISGRGGQPRFATVVGVVEDIKLRSMGEPPGPIAYLPFGQWYRADMVLHVRVAQNAHQVMPRVIEQVHAVEPDLALDIQPMSRATEFSMIPLRVAGTVLGFCGIVGVVLAGLGVFGLVAYAVSLRTREIGIRVALGAGQSALTRLVALQALRPVTIGLVVGLTLSVALAGAIRGLLVNVGPIDPVALSASAAVLVGAAALALVAPLSRAIRVDPVDVLRSE